MIGLLFGSFSVGLSNFAAAIGIGLSGVDNRTRLRIGLAFGFFEALMPILGLLLGEAIAGPLGGLGHYIGAGLLILTGGYLLWKARAKGDGEPLEAPSGLKQASLGFTQLAITALALSLDNLIIGFALSLYDVPLLVAAVVIGGVSVCMSLIGLELGQRLGQRFEAWSEELSAGVLILVGLALGSGVIS